MQPGMCNVVFVRIVVFTATMQTGCIVVIKEQVIRLGEATKETPRPDIAVVEFQPTAGTKYALDRYRDIYAKVTEFFHTYKPDTKDMVASARFMPPGASDGIFVHALSSGEGFVPAKVYFVTDKGQGGNGIRFQLHIPGRHIQY